MISKYFNILNLNANKNNTVKEYKPIQNIYFYDPEYIKKDLINRINHQKFMKNDYFTIEYLNKNYNDDTTIYLNNNKNIFLNSNYKQKFNLNFIHKNYKYLKNKIESVDDEIEITEKKSVKDGLYNDDEIDEIDEIDIDKKIFKNESITIQNSIFAIIISITVLFIKLKLF